MSKVANPETLRNAIRHHQAGRLAEAEVLYRQIIVRNPKCVEALHYLGVIALQSGRSSMAVEFIRRAAALAPNHAAIHLNLGEACRHLNHLDEAIASFRRAVTIRPNDPGALNSLGTALALLGRRDEAIACFEKAVGAQPEVPKYHYNLGIALAENQRLDEAVASLRRAIALNPDFAEAHNYLGGVLKARGQLPEALASFQVAVALQPRSATAHYNVGVCLSGLGQLETATECFQRAIAFKPDFVEAQINLGNLLKDRGQLDDAVAWYQQALALRPDLAETHNNLGAVFRERGRLDDALASFQRALALNPRLAEAHNNVGLILVSRGQLDDAAAAFRRALTLNPDLAAAHNHLGVVLRDLGRQEDAFACFQRALALRPGFANTHNNLGNLFKDRGQLDEALDCYRKALALAPNRADIHSNLILVLHYHAGSTAEDIATELRRWHERHARPLAPQIKPHDCERSPNRRLRIGYVSPDFRYQAVGINLLPLFQRHSHDDFEIFSYSRVPAPDAVTARFRTYSDHWREALQFSDVQLTEVIREDRIDILVDLALHTANNSLLVFARKPAPIQVSFAGYPGRTGLDTIDYHLTDAYLEPPAANFPLGFDAPFYLPHTFWCYDPGAEEQAVSPLPALTSGAVTFGCLNNFCKVSDTVLALWARVLVAVPNSRILLLAAEGDLRGRIVDRFCQAGVSADRVAFVGKKRRSEYLTGYHRTDLGLDTFPYNGHTTSLDSFWMGVPVISLVGASSVSRAGWSQLSNLGLPELAALTTDEFVGIASALANDIPRLTALRAGLRERMRHSPLMDATTFARGIEAAYRTMWQRWCASPALASVSNR